MTVLLNEACLTRSALMRRAQGGDKLAYEALLREVTPMLKGYLKKRLAGDGNQEDLLQQILLRIHIYRGTFSGGDGFDPWMFAIARNVLSDHWRSRKNEEAFSILEAEIEAAQEPDQETVFAMKEALDDLSEESLSALQLTKWDGLDVRKAADMTETTEAALKVRVHRAMKSIRERLWRG